jgi:hypothetical protein
MNKDRLKASSEAYPNFDTVKEHLNFDAFLPEVKKEGALLTLNPKLTALHSVHKGMHPVIFMVLAALHEIFNGNETVTNPPEMADKNR